MKFSELLSEITERHNKRIDIIAKKSQDYATEDALSNFKRVGQIIEIMRIKQLPGPLCYIFTLIILKIDRWINLILKDNTPQNEPIDDTVSDLHNYADLAESLRKRL